MGLGRRKPAALWALALTLACVRHTGLAQQNSMEHNTFSHLLPVVQSPAGDSVHGATILPPLRTIPVVRASNPAHNGRVCSAWGDFHYKTFDGAVFRFPGLCNYVLSSHCGGAYEDFNVQLRRCSRTNATTVCGITLKLDGLVLQLAQRDVLVDGNPVQLPFSQSGVTVERNSNFLKVTARLGLVFVWNQDDSLLLELDPKYANQTCGLCGDFNGIPDLGEFHSNGAPLSPLEFGNLQKLDGPTEQCQDPAPAPEPLTNCSAAAGLCEALLLGGPLAGCGGLVAADGYLEACRRDLCACEPRGAARCLCATLAEFSRQCAHAGGRPADWRRPDLCPAACPLGMQHRECGSPCADTCSDPERAQLCDDHCAAGCFCPDGTVLDDIGQTGCIPVAQCSCVHNGVPYAPGASYSTDCTNCTCSAGRWSCQELPCPGTCAVVGGAHFSTFDERQYTVHGDCSYVLAKPLLGNAFSVLAELRRCGVSESETCLKSVTLSLGAGQTVVEIKASGEVFVNQIYTQLPVSAANVTLLRPSTSFIIAHTQLGLQLDVQLEPTMQVFVRLEPHLRGQTSGLCGNFNQNQADDFRALSGVVEGTAAAFANTWKTQATCPNVKNSFEDPCSLSVENEKYAQRWCSRLTDAQGPFSPCHAVLNPATYYSNCLFDTCNCEKSEDCMCAALSSYVRACAAKGVLLDGWRDGACTKPMTSCPKSMTYQYHISTCQPSCRARGSSDVTCAVSFVPVDGCACPADTFLDDQGKCVPASRCPCYHEGTMVPSGESLHENGALCTCTQGTLTCIGKQSPAPVCAPPMVYFDCRNATAGTPGAACQKSCHTLDMDCYNSQCVSGCVCPDGLVADGRGGCVAETECPCVHNEASYQPGQSIRVGCNTCTCENRKWQCTDEPCLATCAIYGDGHYLTFDGQRYSFSGDCEYTLLQDHCGSGNSSSQDTLRVVTENVPCGTTGTTCSKAIKLFLGSSELRLSDGKAEVIERAPGRVAPFSIRQMGIYLVVDTQAGLVLLWDKKTTLFLRLEPKFKGQVCGLCGNFDDKAFNDFTTRGQSVVGNALEFGNSWKFSPSCPDASAPRDPCAANPYRKSWAQKQCSLINSATFAACHAHVEPAKYYEACVSDACACDSGGDCECFCTAVAAYAQACHDIGVCVSWRTPDICPLFCDYYNPEGQCEWHYQPCGAPCMRTCQNPSGHCLHDLPGLEGCYPKCPPDAPIFDEAQMQCVAACPPPPPAPCHVAGQVYLPGSQVPAQQNCQSCTCTESGVTCVHDSEACVCIYGGLSFRPGDSIYNTTDGTGGCIYASCGANGTIERRILECPPTSAPPTTFTFSTHGVSTTTAPSTHVSVPSTHVSPETTAHHTAPTTPPHPVHSTHHPVTSTQSLPPPTPTGCGQDCQWSEWLDVSRPGRGPDSGDFDTLDNLRAHGHSVCREPQEVQCRAEDAPEVPLEALGQRVHCSPATGLTCLNREQGSGLCRNYQVRVLCCTPRACPPTSSSTSTTPSPSTSPISTVSCHREQCSWTPWIDGSYPQPERNGGDFDTFSNLRAKGYHFCQAPRNVECRAEEYPDTPLAELGQNVVCDTQVGLLCRNEDQLPPICYNYQIRIQCCEMVDECHNTTVPVPSPTTTSTTHSPETTSTTSSPTTRTTSPPATSTTSTHGPSTPAPVSTTSHATAGTSACQPQCSWTHWLDVDFPTPGPKGGDFETYSHIISRGEKVCGRRDYISRLECRAENHPDVSIAQLGQVVQCNPDVGLVCRNKDQKGPFKMCLNYEIRVLCCEPRENCSITSSSVPTTHSTSSPTTPTTSSPTTHTSLSPTTRTTSSPATSTISPATNRPSSSTTPTGFGPMTSTTSSPTTRPTSSPTPKTTSSPTTSTISSPTTRTTLPPATSTTSTPVPSTTSTPVPSTHAPVSTTSHATAGTSACQPQCSWTLWLDVDFPTPGPKGGDFETYSHIISRGEKVCGRRDYISRLECRAENHPDVSIAQLGQVVQCNPDVGLVCRNKDQKGPFKMCLNYEIRVLCCEPRENCSTTPTNIVTKTHSTTPTASSSTTHTTLSPTTRTTSSPATSTPSSSTTPTGFGPMTSTTSSPTTRPTSSPTPKTTSSPTTSTISSPTTRTTLPPATSTTSTPVPSTTSTPVPSTHAPVSTTSHATAGTSACQPQCSWTRWLDVDFPTPGPKGGDFETYSHIISRGEKVCGRRDYISRLECRAENHPDVSIAQLGQVVQCNPDVGLVCRNKDQKGPFKMCLNYEIRVLCCEPRENCSTTSSTTSSSVPTTHSTSSPTTPTTSSPTTRTTSSPTTHTTSPPATSTTSTPVPSTHAPVSTTSHATAGTSACQPQCSWTRWLDVDFPTPGPKGGDFETYSHIISRGEKVCGRRDYISRLECRAENHPDISIAQLGQVVQCNPDVGLVCRNKDQKGPFKMCLNYEIRVLCCEPRENCSTTSSTVPTTHSTSSPMTPTTSSPTTRMTSSSTTHTTSPPATSTTSTHVPSTHAPVSTTSHATAGTSACQPQCSWTRWLDVDFPTPGPKGGDFETYSHIISRGEKVCGRRDYISRLECRAENHPDVSIAQLGQVVQCNPDVGLVCRNKDQKGPFKMCLNYEIRVLCCEPRENCSTPTHIVPMTHTTLSPTTRTTSSSTTLTTSPPATSMTSSPTTNTISSPTTHSSSPPSSPFTLPPTCYCSVSDKLYPAGSIIYQETDLSGHCYYGVCSLDCHVVRGSDQSCQNSTSPPPTPNSSRTRHVDCPNAVPPRKKGETWAMANCSQATCEGNHVISLNPRTCPPVSVPTCANGYPAVPVPDQDGCCHQLQCQCVCSGWGDPHYITFDGTYYTFLDNCTYVLVQQVVPVYGHFRVLVDNYFCDARDGLSCPRAITVEYRTARVTLTRQPVRGLMTNQILFNGELVSPGFQKAGLDVSQVGVKMFVQIPELGVRVMFSGLIFSVEVPLDKFANNTEGQCGTCTNDQKDDCRLPGGTTVTSCSDMSRYWKVTTAEQPSCQGPPPEPWVRPSLPPVSCPPSPICELILSEVFEACHAVIPPQPYYQGCVFDQCYAGNADVVCSSLELYASLCTSHSVCIDWRGRTNHTCPFTCPDNKEYRPCGPANPTYCYGNASLLAFPEGSISEGCFCPEGSTLFSTSMEICVSTECVGCLGPHGEPVEPGQTVVTDCQECTCDATSRTLTCRPQTCPLPPACPAPGLVPVPMVAQAGQCCPTYSCSCNASYCPGPLDCPQGFHLELSHPEDACCPSQTCVLTPGCSVNGTLYQPGAVISRSPCETCKCEAHRDGPTDTFVLNCETKICDSNCSLGFEYQPRSGQCCGVCVQVACVLSSNGSTRLLSPGETWSEPGNNCVSHTCEDHQDRYVVVTTRKACPPLSCPEDQALRDKDGCCLTCPTQNQSTCAVRHRSQVIRQRGCSSAGPVPLAYCHGNCGDTSSMYSLEALTLQRKCRCCQELRVARTNVTLHCPDGSRRTFSYSQVQECGCVGLRCHRSGGQSQELELEWAQEPEPREEPESQEEARGLDAGRWLSGSAQGAAPHQ